nr:protein GVQW3-like [Dermacentor andersoni]
MAERLEQRYCIKFCHKLGDNQVETISKIQTAFGDDAMSRTQLKEWYNRFKDGRTPVESEPRYGRPSKCRNDQVIAEANAVVMRDRRVTIREIAKEVGISTFSAQSNMTEDLAMKRVAAKFVPKLLTVEQKQLRVEVSEDILDSTNSDPDFTSTIITGDESRVYEYEPESKSQSSQWKHSKSPRPNVARDLSSSWFLVNTATVSYFRVQYDANNVALLTHQLLTDHTALTDTARAIFLDDMVALTVRRMVSVDALVGLLTYLQKEESCTVWHLYSETALKALEQFSGRTEYRPFYLRNQELCVLLQLEPTIGGCLEVMRRKTCCNFITCTTPHNTAPK